MPTYTFEELKQPAKRNLKCERCGKRFTRQTTFTQTINPYNRDKTTGLPKRAKQIWAELRAKAEAWAPTPVCTACAAGESR